MASVIDRPPRGRAWRRWRRTIHHDRVLARIMRRRRYSFRLSHYWTRGYYTTYHRRLSITATERLHVRTSHDLELYLIWLARLERDNRKICRCNMCRNPRRSNFSKPWDRLTQQERIAEEIGINNLA